MSAAEFTRVVKLGDGSIHADAGEDGQVFVYWRYGYATLARYIDVSKARELAAALTAAADATDEATREAESGVKL